MGDNINVTCQRVDKTLQKSGLRDCDKNTKKLQLKENPVGEPEEDTCQFLKVSRSIEHITKMEVVAPLISEPEVPPFPYSGTKLRPDAPPFMPECIASLMKSTQDVQPQDSVNDDLCIVNVELETSKDLIISGMEYSDDTAQLPLKELKYSKDPSLKPFSLTSSTCTKRTPTEIDVSAVEMEDVVSVLTNANEIAENSPSVEPSIGCMRFFSARFFLNNRTQIAVLIASSVISVILMVYVLL